VNEKRVFTCIDVLRYGVLTEVVTEIASWDVTPCNLVDVSGKHGASFITIITTYSPGVCMDRLRKTETLNLDIKSLSLRNKFGPHNTNQNYFLLQCNIQ
jgi:hypothetical protein